MASVTSALAAGRTAYAQGGFGAFGNAAEQFTVATGRMLQAGD